MSDIISSEDTYTARELPKSMRSVAKTSSSKSELKKKQSPRTTSTRSSSMGTSLRKLKKSATPVAVSAESCRDPREDGKREEDVPGRWTSCKRRFLAALRFQALAMLISFFVQLLVVLYIGFEMLRLSDENLLYLLGAVVVFLLSLFFTVEVLISRSRQAMWMGISVLFSLLAMALSIFTLVCTIKRSQELENSFRMTPAGDRDQQQFDREHGDYAFVQRLAAVTAIVMVCHMLAVSHGLYEHFLGRRRQRNVAAASGGEKGGQQIIAQRTDSGFDSSAAAPTVADDVEQLAVAPKKQKRPPMTYLTTENID